MKSLDYFKKNNEISIKDMKIKGISFVNFDDVDKKINEPKKFYKSKKKHR